MFLIRRVFDDLQPANRVAMEQVAAILRTQFEALSRQKIDRIPDMLRNPLQYGFRSILYVAEASQARVLGMALLNHDPDLHYCYLDYLAAAKALTGRGVGAALYERVREEAGLLAATGIFFECLPDDPKLCRNPEILKQNRARLRFYEAYGARPIINTSYETPVTPGGDNPPYLVFDGLGEDPVLSKEYLKKVISSILRRKYKDICNPAYNRRVIRSVTDDPVRLRAPHYYSGCRPADPKLGSNPLGKIALVVTDQHEIHHVKERGYVESPVRIRTILRALLPTNLFESVAPRRFEDKWLTAVHDPAYVGYLKRVCDNIDPTATFYPYVFPIRNVTRPPVELPIRAGYYCIDTFTPLNRNAFVAARRAVDCALTAAREVLSGRRATYALVRPPGHHAERGFFGGFCYFNNAAITAQYLARFGRVAMLDVDYHHGNGQQSIFYGRNDILTVSIHGHPRFAYPYFSGFADERGEGPGLGFNANYPLPETIDSALYLHKLRTALARIEDFRATYLVVCLGLDTAKGDPTGSWPLRGPDFAEMGRLIGTLRRPTLVLQEGGYDNRSIGANASHFFHGLASGLGLQLSEEKNNRPSNPPPNKTD